MYTRQTTTTKRSNGEVVLSTDTPCPQDGLILAANGWDLSRFDKVPCKMFYNHSTYGSDDYPIGRWEDLQVKDGKLVGRPVFAADEDPDRAGVVAKLWDGGFLDDVSVSFRVNGKVLTGPVQVEGRDYMVSTSHELLECSVVGIGADQNAGKGRIAEAVTRGVITREQAGALKSCVCRSGQLDLGLVAATARSAVRDIMAQRIKRAVHEALCLMRGRLPD